MLYKQLLEVKDEIIKKYETELMSAAQIAELFCSNKKAYARILRILKENNIRIRDFGETRPRGKHSVNDNYFKVIDSYEKAYWLGFLYADGCIIYRNEFPSKVVLALKDIHPIKDFKEAINSSHKLCRYQVFDKRTKKYYEKNCISITSKFFAINLYNTGLKGKYHYDTKFPDIKEEYIPHFIRGLFDGDGTICKCKNGKSHHFRIGFLGTEKIIDFIKNYFHKILNINNVKTHIKYQNSTGKLMEYYIFSKKDIIFIMDHLYENSTNKTRLERKYNKYQEFLKIEKNKEEFIKENGHNIKMQKPILQYDLSGNFIKEWSCIAKCAKELNFSNGNICNCCQGKRKTANGFIWKYKE